MINQCSLAHRDRCWPWGKPQVWESTRPMGHIYTCSPTSLQSSNCFQSKVYLKKLLLRKTGGGNSLVLEPSKSWVLSIFSKLCWKIHSFFFCSPLCLLSVSSHTQLHGICRYLQKLPENLLSQNHQFIHVNIIFPTLTQVTVLLKVLPLRNEGPFTYNQPSNSKVLPTFPKPFWNLWDVSSSFLILTNILICVTNIKGPFS